MLDYIERPTFRRSGGSSFHVIGVSAIVGVVSGYYIFGIPLRDHFEELKIVENENNGDGESS